MSNPWFRLYSEAVDDEKLRLLAFEDRWHFIAILCCKNNGILDTEPHLMRRKIAVKLGLDLRELGEVARRLAEVGLIDEDTLQPIKWNDRQFKSDTSAERTRAYREKLKRHRDVTVTPQESDTDTDTDTEEESNTGVFQLEPPTIHEENPEKVVQIQKVNRKTPFPKDFVVTGEMFDWAVSLGVNPDQVKPNTFHFKDHHESRGNKFIDWKAAWRNWMRDSVGRFASRK